MTTTRTIVHAIANPQEDRPMLHDLSINVDQLNALAAWASYAPYSADVLIAKREGGSLYVGQGDARCVITIDGLIREED